MAVWKETSRSIAGGMIVIVSSWANLRLVEILRGGSVPVSLTTSAADWNANSAAITADLIGKASRTDA